MAFTVESGNGLPNANSFTSVEYFKAYCTDRGSDAASWDDSRIQKNLVKATTFLAAKYRSRFVGRKATAQQSLPWPRLSAYYKEGGDVADSSLGQVLPGYAIPSNTVPECLQQATVELAIVADSQELAPNITPGEPTTTQTKVGPIEIKYDAKSPLATALPVYPIAHMLIQPILSSSSSNPRLVRC